MKSLFVSSLVSLSLLSSCGTTPNYFIQNEDGFEVDTESVSLIVSSRVLDKDSSYEDELIEISDKLAQVAMVHILSKEELKNLVSDSISNEKRKKVVIDEFGVIFDCYGNASERETYTVNDCNAVIEKISDGIIKAVEIHWVTIGKELK